MDISKLGRHSFAVLDRNSETRVLCGSCGTQLASRLGLGNRGKAPPRVRGRHLNWRQYMQLCISNDAMMPALCFSLAWRLDPDSTWKWTNRARKAHKHGRCTAMPNRARRAAERLQGPSSAARLGVMLRPALLMPLELCTGSDACVPIKAECPKCGSIQILDPDRLKCDITGGHAPGTRDGSIANKETLDGIQLTDEQWQRLAAAGESYGFEFETMLKGKPILLMGME